MRKFTRGAAALVLGSTLTAAAAQPPAGTPAPATPPAAVPPPAGTVPPPAATPGAVPPPAGVSPMTPGAPATPPAKPEPRPTGTAATVVYGQSSQPIPEVAVHRALRQFPPANRAVARTEIINHLVENTLIDLYLAAIKVNVEPKEVEALIADLKKELATAKKDYATELAAMMLTEEEFRAEVLAQLKWEAFVKQQATDAALQQLFTSSPDVFDGSMVRARHVLLNPGNDPAKQAEADGKLRGIKQVVEQEAAKAEAAAPPTADALAKAQIKAQKTDELFAAYAKEYSVCPSKRDGGDLNFFPRAGAMVEPFAKAAFGLQPGQMSDVVVTEFGHHLILVTARKPGTPKKFEEVREDVKLLYAMRLREAVIGQMKPKAQVTVNPDPNPTPAGAAPGTSNVSTPATPGSPMTPAGAPATPAPAAPMTPAGAPAAPAAPPKM